MTRLSLIDLLIKNQLTMSKYKNEKEERIRTYIILYFTKCTMCVYIRETYEVEYNKYTRIKCNLYFFEYFYIYL